MLQNNTQPTRHSQTRPIPIVRQTEAPRASTYDNAIRQIFSPITSLSPRHPASVTLNIQFEEPIGSEYNPHAMEIEPVEEDTDSHTNSEGVSLIPRRQNVLPVVINIYPPTQPEEQDENQFDYTTTLAEIEKRYPLKRRNLKKLSLALAKLFALALPGYFVAEGCFNCGRNVSTPSANLSTITGIPSAFFNSFDNLPVLIGAGGGLANWFLIVNSLNSVIGNAALFAKFLSPRQNGGKAFIHGFALISVLVGSLSYYVNLIEGGNNKWIASLNAILQLPPSASGYFCLYILAIRMSQEEQQFRAMINATSQKFLVDFDKKFDLLERGLGSILSAEENNLSHHDVRDSLESLQNFIIAYKERGRTVSSHRRDKQVELFIVEKLFHEIFSKQLVEEGDIALRNQILLQFAKSLGVTPPPISQKHHAAQYLLYLIALLGCLFNWYNLAKIMFKFENVLHIPDAEQLGYLFALLPLFTKIAMYLCAQKNAMTAATGTPQGAHWFWQEPWFIKTSITACLAFSAYAYLTSGFCAANSNQDAWGEFADGKWQALMIFLFGTTGNDIFRVATNWCALISATTVNVFAGVLPATLKWSGILLNHFVGALGCKQAPDAPGSFGDHLDTLSTSLETLEPAAIDRYKIDRDHIFSRAQPTETPAALLDETTPLQTAAQESYGTLATTTPANSTDRMDEYVDIQIHTPPPSINETPQEISSSTTETLKEPSCINTLLSNCMRFLWCAQTRATNNQTNTSTVIVASPPTQDLARAEFNCCW